MEIIYKYIKFYVSKCNVNKCNVNKCNIKKIKILDLGINCNGIINLIRRDMYICIYDLLKIPLYDLEMFNWGLGNYNGIYKINEIKNKKYNFLIIHNNLEDISQLLFKNNNKNFEEILKGLTFIIEKNGFVFLLINKKNMIKYNVKVDDYLGGKIKNKCCLGINKKNNFKYYFLYLYIKN